jgi:rare lipoprotein A (peptidoglycan hydrolase)
MRKIARNILLIVLAIFILDLGISLWIFNHDLYTRFPNLDWRKARFGTASWYSEDDQNIHPYTASREKFDDSKMTCASWDYDFNTNLLVINPFTGKWVVCRVNDRGPAKHLNRQVDLTKAAFKKIAKLHKGLTYIAFLPVEEAK